MRNLFIPPLGTEIELAADWRFRLHDEYRNAKMVNLLAPKLPTRTVDGFWGLSPHEQLELMNKSGWMIESGKFRSQSDIGIYADQKFAYVTLPAGTRLKVQRIYIRQGQKSFDSVTFSVTGLPADIAERVPKLAKKKPSALGRFWVKLDDANQIEVAGATPVSFPTEVHFSHSVADDEKFNAEGLIFLGAGTCDGKEVHCFARPSATARD